MQKGEVMTDRELLELAAKAAGINLQWMGGPVEVRDGIITAWNPLFDDGEALKLAVKLRLAIRLSDNGVMVGSGLVVFSESGLDVYSATRRAIVRAAAEIGENA